MSIKATLRKPAAKTVATPPSTAPAPDDVESQLAGRAAVIDVESEQVTNEDNSAPEGREVVETSTAVAHRPQAAVTSYADGDGTEGEWDQGDIKLPIMKIVNGSGPLSKTYNQGTLLYADEELWGPPSPKAGEPRPMMRFVPIKLVKMFKENLTEDEQDEGIMPRIVRTRDEALKLTPGEHVGYVNNEKGRWSPIAQCFVLLEEPAGSEHTGFSFQLDGKNYAPAVFWATGMAYTAFARTIFNAGRMQLKDHTTGRAMYYKRFWEMRITKGGKKFVVFVPEIKLTKEETGAEIRQFAQDLLGNQAAVAASEE
jgi:hypothetical protein